MESFVAIIHTYTYTLTTEAFWVVMISDGLTSCERGIDRRKWWQLLVPSTNTALLHKNTVLVSYSAFELESIGDKPLLKGAQDLGHQVCTVIGGLT